MKAYIFPNPYIPGGPLGKVEIPGSRASSRTMVPSMLDWLRQVCGGQRQRHQSRQHQAQQVSRCPCPWLGSHSGKQRAGVAD